MPKIDQSLVRDTNGAGDTFVGAFFAALAAGKTVSDAVRCGQDLAGQVVQNSGVSFEEDKKPKQNTVQVSESESEDKVPAIRGLIRRFTSTGSNFCPN